MEAELERGPYDGYITPRWGGWEIAAHGVIVGLALDEGTARTILAEHCATRPRWKVDADGVAELIAAP